MDTLGELGTDAKVLAGGQSLVPMLNMRLAAPANLVDVNFVEDAAPLAVAGDRVAAGLLVRQREVEVSPDVRSACPLLGEALAHVAHRAVRSRGTVVGSLVHADPAAELPAVFVLLDGRLRVVSPRGTREIPAGELYRGWYETTLDPDELAVEASVRCTGDHEGVAFLEVARRRGDFALCAVAAVVSDTEARVALAGVDAAPRAFDVTPVLEGSRDALLGEVIAQLDPADDVHASAAFRRHLAGVLVRRALAEASSRREEALA